VHELVSSGAMPPEERPRPADAETRDALSWIEKEQKAFRSDGTRRLNRRELSAALRDLTGLSVDYADALAGDGTVDGFDTVAEALQDAADSVDQAMEAARRAADGLRFLEPSPRKALSADLRGLKDARKALDPWKTEGVVPRLGGTSPSALGLLLHPQWVGDRAETGFWVAPPADRRGILRIKVVVSALRRIAGLPNPHLWVEIGGKAFDRREIEADRPRELVYEAQIEDLATEPRGIAVSLACRVEVPYAVEGFENEDRSRPDQPPVPGGTGLFRPAFDRKQLPPERQPVPFIVLHEVEIDSDHVRAWGSEAGPLADDDACATRLLGLWTERAWRRPAGASELEPFLALYRAQRSRGAAFDPALRAAFQSVLMSGPFRYLAPSPDPGAGTASRLGFALLGAPPDAELRRRGASGDLRDPAALDAQVDRLLADPRSDGFFRPFVTQWLELGQPITIAMDHLQKQDYRFARNLKASMGEETVAYVAELFRKNRPAREIVAGDWTMMNDVLALHYGYPGIEGGRLRRVALRPDDPRGGGILGHAGIQSMLCWMGDTWVVYRGAWTLRHLLDAPPPPPPLEVPELDVSEHPGRTMREMLRRHQEDPKCATCHRTIDPLGFAFQNFDLSGRWRTVEFERYEKKELDGKIEWRGAGKTRPVDAAGRLPRGEEFRDFAHFKELVVARYEQDLARGLLKSLFLYVAGRRPDAADAATIRTILEELAPKGYPLRDCLKAVVRTLAP
jgi:hypothetical protein